MKAFQFWNLAKTDLTAFATDLADDLAALRRVLANLGNLGAATGANVGIGTTTTKVRTNATFNYFIDGVVKTKASTDDFWTLSGTTIAAGFAQKYLLLIDAAGAASIQECLPGTTLALVGYPTLPDSKCVVGTVNVVVNSSTFVPGTTALNAGTITVTYTNGFDINMLPLKTTR